MRAPIVILGFLLLSNGCLESDTRSRLVPSSSFGDAGTAIAAANAPPAPSFSTSVPAIPAANDVTARVNFVGQKLVEANPQLGIKPRFLAVANPRPEISHQGTSEITITDSLVRQFAADNQLAALVSLELAKIVVEREKSLRAAKRDVETEPPIGVTIGNAGGDADPVRMAELAKFENTHPRLNNRETPPLDPHVLANEYLQRAGFTAR